MIANVCAKNAFDNFGFFKSLQYLDIVGIIVYDNN